MVRTTLADGTVEVRAIVGGPVLFREGTRPAVPWETPSTKNWRDGEESTGALVDAIRAAESRRMPVRIPAGNFKICDAVKVRLGRTRCTGEGRGITVLDFDLDEETDGLTWEGPGGLDYNYFSGLRDMTIMSSRRTVRDLVRISKWVHFAVENMEIIGAARHTLNVDVCINVNVRNCDLCQAVDGLDGGVSCLYVADGSTTTHVSDTYIHNAAQGPGADVVEASFTNTIVESNGYAFSHHLQGDQDPLNGVGVRFRRGNCLVVGGHFENNAGHAMVFGTHGESTMTVVGVGVGGDEGNYTQTTSAAIWADYVTGGAVIGLRPYIARSVVFTERASGVFVGGLNTLNTCFVNPPEYLGKTWRGEPADISCFPGLLHFRDPVTGYNVTTGGIGTSPGVAIGNVFLGSPRRIGDGFGPLYRGKIYLNYSLDNPNTGTPVQSLGMSEDMLTLELVGAPMGVESLRVGRTELTEEKLAALLALVPA